MPGKGTSPNKSDSRSPSSIKLADEINSGTLADNNLSNLEKEVGGDLMDELTLASKSASASKSAPAPALVEKFDKKFLTQLDEVKKLEVSQEKARPVIDYLTELSIKLSKYGNPRPFITFIDHDLEILRSIQLYVPDSNPDLNSKVEAIFKMINQKFLNFGNISVESFLKKTQDKNFLMAYLDIRSKLIRVKEHLGDKKLNEHLEFIEENSKELHRECRKNSGQMKLALASKPGDETFALPLKVKNLDKSELFKAMQPSVQSLPLYKYCANRVIGGNP